jgi:hypothetical protein
MRATLVGVVAAQALVALVPASAAAPTGYDSSTLVLKSLDRLLAGLVVVRPQS